MSKHKMVDGRLLQMNKSYGQLKTKQKERIAAWMYEAYKKQVSEGLSDEEALQLVFDRIEEAQIWIPDYEVEKRYRSKKVQFRNRLAGENVPQHIYQMEHILDTANQKMDALEQKIKEYEAYQAEIQKLQAYYESQQWKDDFAMDEAGKFPAKLKRGILSEDGIYNMLERNQELLERIRDSHCGSAERTMKTIRLLYPDHVSGGLDTYYFGANLLQYILPENPNQPIVRVDVLPPDGTEKSVTNGIYAEDEVLSGIRDAQAKLSEEAPDRVITIGGNCMVSLAPFDYLHGKYENTGIIWIDAHPDVDLSEPDENRVYPSGMVLGTLLGGGAKILRQQMKNPYFMSQDVLFVGLQEPLPWQKEWMQEHHVAYQAQTQGFLQDEEIKSFLCRFDHILVHLDIDVLDEHFFHSTYYANPELPGDGAGSGRMTMEKLAEILSLIEKNVDVVGFTVAEYLPFDEHRLHKMLSGIKLFTE